jgi:hypothetical protein
VVADGALVDDVALAHQLIQIARHVPTPHATIMPTGPGGAHSV